MTNKHKWRHQVSAGLGFGVMILPFLGFPSVYHQVMLTVIGVILVGLGLTGSRQASVSSNNQDTTDSVDQNLGGGDDPGDSLDY